MGGATGSGQDMETGRTNRAEGRTILWAQVPPGESNFNGPAILIVEVAKDAEDPDDYDDGDNFEPSNLFHGLVATGWSGGSASDFGGTPGASGVIGRGGRNQGTGVVGLGGGSPEPNNAGAGGIGVHGLGGPQADFFFDPATPPGAGVIGQGGRQSEMGNTAQLPHAAGVIAIGGGIGRNKDILPAHPLSATGGVGVYAQGAEQSLIMVPPSDETGTIPGPNVPSGPLAAGAGVLGRGGVAIAPADGPAAAGVIGLAGGMPIPNIFETGNTGVYGAGDNGVTGVGGNGSGVVGRSDGRPGVIGSSTSAAGVAGGSNKGVGVSGSSAESNGGYFFSGEAAQIHLEPLKNPLADPNGVIVGRAGDLLVLKEPIDERSTELATLWFCTQSDKDSKKPGTGGKWVKIA